jgi:hypothetical protein
MRFGLARERIAAVGRAVCLAPPSPPSWFYVSTSFANPRRCSLAAPFLAADNLDRSRLETTNIFDSACSRSFRSSVLQHRQHRCRSRLAKRSRGFSRAVRGPSTDIDESMKPADVVAAATRAAAWASGVACKPRPPNSA